MISLDLRVPQHRPTARALHLMGADKSTPGTAYLEAQFWADSKSENLKSVVPQVRSLNDL